MEKDKIFFGEKGLTSTSANHIANLAKEKIRLLEDELKNAEFVNIDIALIGSSEHSVIQEGVDGSFLTNLKESLTSIAEAKSLIAWIREAIKAKERLLKEVEEMDSTTFCALNGIEYPLQPAIGHTLTQDEYLATLTVKERNKYYHLETLCAVIGKYIHPDNTLADRRKELSHAIKHPHKVSGSGRDAIIYTHTPSVKVEDVEETFFELQALHRQYQAELNSIKYKMEKAISDDEIAKRAEYEKASKEYYAVVAEIHNKLAAWKAKEAQKVSELKIVIPNSLQAVYDAIAALGK